ncbi:hypothetical protein [Bradyrhizobium betae]|uniref:Uncharacterized protein n=1 Tax=Bradyrhizobium betae TaxID=244734 RepID=A0A4V1P4M9_9BRAD|nr:hypothetical protein [Bradyrhizobium betae]RXT40267.1 hypothetical protein B5V03_28680 [Bradyrhizobium betae]
MAKTKRRGRPELSTSYYILQITDWDWSYHFGVNAARHDDRRYSDYRHLLVRGEVLRPSKLRQKAEAVEVTFLPDVSQADLEQRGGEPSLSVGYWQVHNKILTGGISMATDALGLVMQMLIAGRFKSVRRVSAAIILKPSSIPRTTRTNEIAFAVSARPAMPDRAVARRARRGLVPLGFHPSLKTFRSLPVSTTR